MSAVSDKTQHKVRLPIPGEIALEHAPEVRLSNGNLCIPQHYLQYRHTRVSIEQLIVDIDYSERFPLFVDEDETGLFLQVGVIGKDNYKSELNEKMVYGRKWRIEPNLPTSEIIQTAFLALKKAREHEVREWFHLRIGSRLTTPFNNHLDLPLMAHNSDLLIVSETNYNGSNPKRWIESQLEYVDYGGGKFHLLKLEYRNQQQWLLDLRLSSAQPKTQEPQIFTLMLNDLSPSHLYYALMDQLIAHSDRHIDENFTYQGYPRFSRKNQVAAIASLSLALRNPHGATPDLEHELQSSNYQTDETRVPRLHPGPLASKVQTAIRDMLPLNGMLPRGFSL